MIATLLLAAALSTSDSAAAPNYGDDSVWNRHLERIYQHDPDMQEYDWMMEREHARYKGATWDKLSRTFWESSDSPYHEFA